MAKAKYIYTDRYEIEPDEAQRLCQHFGIPAVANDEVKANFPHLFRDGFFHWDALEWHFSTSTLGNINLEAVAGGLYLRIPLPADAPQILTDYRKEQRKMEKTEFSLADFWKTRPADEGWGIDTQVLETSAGVVVKATISQDGNIVMSAHSDAHRDIAESQNQAIERAVGYLPLRQQ